MTRKINLISNFARESELNNHSRLNYVTKIVSAYVTCNHIAQKELPDLIQLVHHSVSSLESQRNDIQLIKHQSEASINKSVQPEGIVSFLDGKPYRSLKRHLAANGLTPQEYRTLYGLPADYPMIASEYAALRSRIAKEIGLGLKAA